MAAKLDITSTITLKSGQKLPVLGFGVWESPRDKTIQSCLSALSAGYRHIDTAQVYGNEPEVGEAIRKCGLKREDIFITSKVLAPEDSDEKTYEKCLESVRKIFGDGDEGAYLDLMLIHNVTSGREGVRRLWGALERLYEEGRIKSIGVSNMGIGGIQGMKHHAKIWPPHINQLELHPWCQQRPLTTFCHDNSIAISAYCPLVRNQKAADPTLTSLASKHSKSTAQVLLRYALQKGWVPLPKSDNAERIKQNAEVFDFELDGGDMERLDGLDQGEDGALVMVADNMELK